MNWLLGIPYVNRPDLLRRALASVADAWPEPILVDNSEPGDLILQAQSWPAEIVRLPGVSPLSFSQSMNLLQSLALERKCPAWFFMHSDAEADQRIADCLVREVKAARQRRRRWGAIFTHYDTFCAFNTCALVEVGPWDVNLPQYFADNDYYYRLRLAGYRLTDLKLDVVHHEGGSCTLKNDAKRQLLNYVTFPLYEKYYQAKWGGLPHHEIFKRPFDSPLFQAAAQQDAARTGRRHRTL